MLGYTRDECLAMRTQMLAEVAPGWSEADRRRLRAEGHWRGELKVRPKNRAPVAVEASVQRVEIDNDTLYLAALRDISERRFVERMQRDILSIVSHELRTPLTSLSGYAQLLKRKGAYEEEWVDALLAQTRHLDRLIADVLEVSRLQTGRLSLRRTELDLVGLAKTTAAQIQMDAPDHPIRVEAAGGPVVGRWDPNRLVQVLQNLLSNAAKFSPARTPIVVRVAALPEAARVSVHDEGAGIPAEALAWVFERFYQVNSQMARAKGLGLGLFVSKLLVEAHGGRIWAESAGNGQGSTFYFTLPYRPT
jgi:signal transduction histidine kinase